MMAPIYPQLLYKAILKFPEISVLIVGDLILDEYVYGETERISPEAPVQVVDVKQNLYSLGGAGNVANNVISLGAKAFVAGVIGEDEEGKILIEKFKEKGISPEGIIKEDKRPTTKKTRIIANGQHIVRLDREVRRPISSHTEGLLLDYILSNCKDIDAVIVSDYAKGVVTERILSSLKKRFVHKPILVDPKGLNFNKYRGVTAITPNKKEALSASREEDILAAGKKFLKELYLKAVFITLGKEGIFFIDKNGESAHIPAMAKEVYDVSGAGDTVVSTLCLSLASGLSFYEAAYLANLAGSIVVGKLGTAPVYKNELTNALFEDFTKTKVLDISDLIQRIAYLKGQGKKIVFTNGCFDIIHPGHIHLLRESKKIGDVLVVALDDDESVKKVKGAGRPVLNQFERAQIISALDCVDYVIIFSTDKLRQILEKIKPDFLTKGEDYIGKEVVGKEIVERYGGKVILIPFSQKGSSSEIIDKIKKVAC